MEHYLRQNNAVDIYEEYFCSHKSTKVASDPPSTKTISVFRDPNEHKRTVTHISWYPDGANRLAAAYSVLEFQKSSDDTSLESYIWELGEVLHYIHVCDHSHLLHTYCTASHCSHGLCSRYVVLSRSGIFPHVCRRGAHSCNTYNC